MDLTAYRRDLDTRADQAPTHAQFVALITEREQADYLQIALSPQAQGNTHIVIVQTDGYAWLMQGFYNSETDTFTEADDDDAPCPPTNAPWLDFADPEAFDTCTADWPFRLDSALLSIDKIVAQMKPELAQKGVTF